MTYKTAQIRLVSSHPEVYEPCDDSFALVDTLLADRTNLEVTGAYYVATDINPHAVAVTRKTLEAHGIHAELVVTDIASGLETRLTRSVDVMVVNPPYVPTPVEEVGGNGITSAWAGGENGRSVIDKILPIADKLLSDRGWLYMVTLTANEPSEICLNMRKKGYASRIVLQRSTEEESLHIIKFWRDPELEVTEIKMSNKPGHGTVIGSLLSQISQISFLSNCSSN